MQYTSQLACTCASHPSQTAYHDPSSFAEPWPYLVLQWGAVETTPRRYNFQGYKQLLQMVKAHNLKLQVCTPCLLMPPQKSLLYTNGPIRACLLPFRHLTALWLALQVVLSFHACGGNVNDVAQIPLPAWVLKVCAPDTCRAPYAESHSGRVVARAGSAN
jgi:Glycosyl hydrolase family 14